MCPLKVDDDWAGQSATTMPQLSLSCPLLLKGEHLACQRGGRRIFTGVTIEVHASQAVWLRGANGCGKTSLLRILAGLAHAEEGTVTNAQGGHRPAYVSHSNALKDELRVQEALSFLCSLHGPVPDTATMKTALAPFGLDRRLGATVRKLSQGQKRKVALARLWLTEASVWLLDEPYDALDRAGCEVLDGAIANHLSRGGGVILTSHQEVRLAGVQVHDLEAERAP